jgi:hypothetical protein
MNDRILRGTERLDNGAASHAPSQSHYPRYFVRTQHQIRVSILYPCSTSSLCLSRVELFNTTWSVESGVGSTMQIPWMYQQSGACVQGRLESCMWIKVTGVGRTEVFVVHTNHMKNCVRRNSNLDLGALIA